MGKKLTIRWQAEDGYAGGARPQYFKIDLDEMLSDCDTEEEARDYIESEVQYDFEKKVTCCTLNADEIVAAWLAAKEAASG